MQQISILGIGLMGGSLGLAARASGLGARVHAYARRAETRDLCMEMGVADKVFDTVEGAAHGADVAVVCVPILSTRQLASAAAKVMRPGTVITDVGSTKAFLCREVTDALSGSGMHFVGSHPIAGSDMTGVESSRADLYRGATVVVTPGNCPRAAVALVSEMWAAIGADVVETTPQEHDLILAKTSHLPHLIAAALVRTVLGGDDELGQFCGTGFGDATRIASGSPEVWHDIVKTNAEALARELRGLGAIAETLASQMESGKLEDVRQFLQDCQRRRMTWGDRNNE